jgi:hypothetical protein
MAKRTLCVPIRGRGKSSFFRVKASRTDTANSLGLLGMPGKWHRLSGWTGMIAAAPEEGADAIGDVSPRRGNVYMSDAVVGPALGASHWARLGCIKGEKTPTLLTKTDQTTDFSLKRSRSQEIAQGELGTPRPYPFCSAGHVAVEFLVACEGLRAFRGFCSQPGPGRHSRRD